MLTDFDVAYEDKYLFEFYDGWDKMSPRWGLMCYHSEVYQNFSPMGFTKKT